MLPDLSSRVSRRLLGEGKRAWSPLREPNASSASERSGCEPRARDGPEGLSFAPVERASRVLGAAFAPAKKDDPDRSPRNRERRAGNERLETEGAVLGRATLFALATIAGTTDSGVGPDGPRENGAGRVNNSGSTDEATSGRWLRENGPVVLVPLAWSFATAAHLALLEHRTVVIAHLVMDVILTTFAAASWSEMTEDVLRAWKLVLLVGLGFTLSGTAALFGGSDESNSESSEAAKAGNETVLSLTVLAWMLVPAAGLAYTGLCVEENEAPRVYLTGAALSVLGAFAYASAPSDSPAAPQKLLGLTLANVGQTAGIVNAVYQY